MVVFFDESVFILLSRSLILSRTAIVDTVYLHHARSKNGVLSRYIQYDSFLFSYLARFLLETISHLENPAVEKLSN